MNRAYYSATIQSFIQDDSRKIFGILAEKHGFELEDQQKYAWIVQIEVLKRILINIHGYIYFEFSIPRMGKRVDVVLLTNGIIFVLEFKVGEHQYPAYALEQVMDYALDLKNFHETSHQLPIVPILISTLANPAPISLHAYLDKVYMPIKANTQNLGEMLEICLQEITPSQIDPNKWESGQYRPTPTIVEAARALYQGHNVSDISRFDAGAINLRETSDAIDNIIDQARQNGRKAICFITGVPGSGKTLAGLNIANRRLQIENDEHAVFLSGNGPLVTVLREALVRDDMSRGEMRKEARRKAEAFIQNIHLFRDEYFENPHAPLERVVIFDEAQRAWTQEMAANFMKRKRGVPDFDMSEPEFMIRVMDRHFDWAVIICLVGGGQEINTGEAGLFEWLYALKKYFPSWQVFVSQQITDSEYLANKNLLDILPPKQLVIENKLHLAVSVRSYRSEKVSALVKAILDCDLEAARELYSQVAPFYPIFLTRDLQKARDWVREKARGGERYGILASSGAARLRPEGIFMNASIEVDHWFLDERSDVRSSFALEGVASEFDIQGLELDWAIVAWDADLRFTDEQWEFKSFKGNKWLSVGNATRQLYLKNSYRVLLTRSRQGMIIFVPYGVEEDPTRRPLYYSGTFNYLQNIGLKTL